MKITLESTEQIVVINDVPTRVWQGRSEKGVAIEAYIPLIRVNKNDDCREFEAELEAQHLSSVAAITAVLTQLMHKETPS